MKALLALVLAGLVAASACSRPDESEEASEAHGPHGGRWLEDGDFALEVAIHESGGRAELRAWAYRAGDPIDPARVALEATLERLGGRRDRIAFSALGDRLVGDRPIEEPHSFDVEILARSDGAEHRFRYASYENRVELTPEQIAQAGIELATAGPATIRESLPLNGRIVANQDALAHVMPRFPGIARSVHARLGEQVAKGARLVVIESNESLHAYELRAPLDGTVIAKDVVPGEFVASERVLFAIADLRSVWVDLDVYRRDFARLRVGQPVRVDAGDGSAPAETALAYLAPVGNATTQTLLARAVLPNPDGVWSPGMFVTGHVEVSADTVPVAVRREAMQRLGSGDVVFVAAGSTFEAWPVETGRRDASHVEIVSGLAPGQRYAANGSFVLKAELGKSGAAHEH